MPTLIDSLIVTLKLDGKDFSKGSAEANKALGETRENVKKSSEAMVASLKSVAVQFVGLFVAVRSVQDIVAFFVDLNANTRQLGIDAKNFGVSAAELRNWQNVAKLAGGSAEDATKTIGSLQQSIFNLKFKGEVSDQLQYLMRLGVQFQTATGAAAPFKDVIFGIAKAMDASKLSQADKTNYLQAMGFDKGLVNALSEGTKGLTHYLEAARKLPQETPQQVEAAKRMAEAWDLLKENISASAQQMLVAAEPAIRRLFDALDEGIAWFNKPENSQKVIDWFTRLGAWVGGEGGDHLVAFFKDFAAIVHDLADALGLVATADPAKAFSKNGQADPDQWKKDLEKGKVPGPSALQQLKRLGTGLGEAAGWVSVAAGQVNEVREKATATIKALPGSIGAMFQSVAANRAQYTPVLAAAEAKYGIPAGILQRIAQTESGFRGEVISGQRKSSAGAVGIMQFMPATNPQAGKDPNADIDAGGKYLRQLYNQFGNWDVAVMAYNDGPGKIGKALAAHGGNVQALLNDRTATNAETRNYRAQVMGGNAQAMNAAHGTQSIPTARAQAPDTANNTNVDIGQITIHSQATDAATLARDLHAAVQRRFAVAQADSGMLA